MHRSCSSQRWPRSPQRRHSPPPVRNRRPPCPRAAFAPMSSSSPTTSSRAGKPARAVTRLPPGTGVGARGRRLGASRGRWWMVPGGAARREHVHGGVTSSHAERRDERHPAARAGRRQCDRLEGTRRNRGACRVRRVRRRRTRARYDDYAGIDVRGKIVAVFSNAPSSFPSEPRAHYASADLKQRNAADCGAVALVTVLGPDDQSGTRGAR